MRLWERASGAVKDHNSLLQAALFSRPNPDIERAVILCTSHTDLSFDRRSLQRLRHWLRLCPYNLSLLLDSLSRRLSRTRSWIVAIKGLYLIHTLINSRLSCVTSIGRLPFDLSDFNSGCDSKSLPFAQFIRSYYKFLDQKLVVVSQGGGGADKDSFLLREIDVLENLQKLIDLLLKIRPKSKEVLGTLILEVMDWIAVEIKDLYGMVCRGIAIVLMNIYAGGKVEAMKALNVVEKVNRQGEEISEYFKECRNLGVSQFAGFEAILPVSEEGIQELKQIVNTFEEYDDDDDDNDDEDCESGEEGRLEKTVITEKWESFDDDDDDDEEDEDEQMVKTSDEDIPDLITL